MIEEIPVSKLDPRQVKQLEGAEKVLNSNPNYAKEIYSAVVKTFTRLPGSKEKIAITSVSHDLEIKQRPFRYFWKGHRRSFYVWRKSR